MTVVVLSVLALLLAVVAFAALALVNDRPDRRARGPSPWRYGAGAYHVPDNLPPITRCTTSVPTGSSLPGHFPNSNALRNRADRHVP